MVVAVKNDLSLALSVTVLEPKNVHEDIEDLEKKLQEFGEINQKQIGHLSLFKLSYIDPSLFYPHSSWIYIGTASSLKEFCQKAVAKFDGALLNEERRLVQKFTIRAAQISLLIRTVKAKV